MLFWVVGGGGGVFRLLMVWGIILKTGIRTAKRACFRVQGLGLGTGIRSAERACFWR